MKKILQMYAKMGKIASQIDVLQDRLKTKSFNKSFQTVGGSTLRTIKDLEFMIDLQWARIRALESAILNSENETLSYVEDLRDSMCKDCLMDPEKPCQKDYTKMSLYKTLQEVIV